MNNWPTDPAEEQDWIDRYLANQLTPAERADFETQVGADPRRKQELEDMRQTHTHILEALLAQQTRQTLRQLQQEARTQRTPDTDAGPLPVRPLSAPPPRRLRLGQRVAVFGLALLLLVGWLSSPVRLPNDEADYSIVRGLADDSLARSPQNQAFRHFFEGQAKLTEGQYALAAQHFETVLRIPDLRPYFREATLWHLILVYLYSGQPVRAEALLNRFELTDTEGAYPVGRLDRLKLRWQIRWAKWTN